MQCLWVLVAGLSQTVLHAWQSRKRAVLRLSCLRGGLCGILVKEVKSAQHESADLCWSRHGGTNCSEVDTKWRAAAVMPESRESLAACEDDTTRFKSDTLVMLISIHKCVTVMGGSKK